LEAAGADGLVLFNRYFEPDINVEELEVQPHLELSTSSELLMRLRWLGLLSGQTNGSSLAITGGVHTYVDAIKATMAGADAIQLVSSLLRNGRKQLVDICRDMTEWMEEKEYESLAQMKGSMNSARSPDPKALSRGNYIKLLQTWSLE
jgi:dihydroorotate dehydrogenase (fumarate)